MYFVKDITNEGFDCGAEVFFFKKKENAKKKFAEIIMNWYNQYPDEIQFVEEDWGSMENYIEECWKDGECVDLAEFGKIKWED